MSLVKSNGLAADTFLTIQFAAPTCPSLRNWPWIFLSSHATPHSLWFQRDLAQAKQRIPFSKPEGQKDLSWDKDNIVLSGVWLGITEK